MNHRLPFQPGVVRRTPLSAFFLPGLLALALSLPAPAAAAESSSGADLYTQNCAGCHGRDGKAQTRLGRKSGAKDLTDKKALARLSDADIVSVIRLGRKNARGEELMEPFAQVLSEAQAATVAAYVRTFSR